MAGRPLAEAFVRVRADTNGVRSDIRKDFDQAGRDGGQAFGEAFTRDARGRLHDANGRFVRELEAGGEDGGRRAGNRFAAAFGDAFRRLGPLLGKALGGAGIAGLVKLAAGAKTAMLAIAGLAAGIAALHTVVQTGAALAPLTGLLALLPGVALTAAAALGSLKLATSGVGDAFAQALAADNPKKLAEAMKDLSPAARSVTLELARLHPLLLRVRNTAQQALFKPLVGQLTATAHALSGPISAGAAQVAGQFGLAGRAVARFVRESTTVHAIRDAFGTAAVSIHALLPAIQPVLTGLRNLGVLGTTFLPGIANSVSQVAQRFGAWLQQIVASGQAARWIHNALATLKQVGTVLSNVGGILKSVFSAASAAGSGFLGVIGQALAQLNAFLKTAAGQQALTAIFTALGTIGQTLGPVIGALVTGLGALAPPLAQLATLVGPILTTAITALAPALASLAPGLQALFGGLGQAIELVAPALLPLGRAIAQIGVAIGPILPVVGQLVGQLVSGLAPILGTLVTALAPLVLAVVRFAGALTPLISPLAQIIVQLVSGLVPALTPLIGILGQVAGVVGQFLISAIQMLVSAIVPLLPQLSQMAATVGGQLMVVLQALAPALLQVLQALLPLLPSLISMTPVWVQLLVAVTPLVVLLTRLAAVILRTLLPPVVSIVGWLLRFNATVWGSTLGSVVAVVSAIGRLPGAIVGKLSGAGKWLVNVGKNVVYGLWNGIASLGSWLYNRVWAWVKSVLPGAVKWALGIHSPSLVMAELGRFAGAGLAVGIDDSRTGVSRAATRLAGAAVPAMGSNGLTLATAGTTAGRAGTSADDIAAAVTRALDGLGIHMDGQKVGALLSRRLGQQTDLRRRTG